MDRALIQAALARVHSSIQDDHREKAALALERLGVDIGDVELRAQSTALLARTRRTEAELMSGAISRADAEAARNNILLSLNKLVLDCERRLLVPSPAKEGATDAPRAVLARPAAPETGGTERASGHSPERDARKMVICDGLTRSYGPRYRLGPISFELGHGEVLGVVGANGAGKTSLLRIIAGELAHDTGSCTLSKVDVTDRPLLTPVLFVPESPPKWKGTVAEYLGWQAALFGRTGAKENRTYVEHALSQLDVVEDRDRRWAQLSDGIRMRVAIAACLVANPCLIVLDEPLAPLDPRSQQQLLQWISGYAKDHRRTTFVISAHHVEEIESVADQVLCLMGSGVPARATAVRRDRGTPPATRYFRVRLGPSSDRSLFRDRIKELRERGEVIDCIELPAFFLVLAAVSEPEPLAALLDRLKGTGITAIHDLSESHLRLLLWGSQ